jgi:hypothetical protein
MTESRQQRYAQEITMNEKRMLLKFTQRNARSMSRIESNENEI